MCFLALFVSPMGDVFLIKIELRIIWMINTVEIVLYHTFLYTVGDIAAFLSLSGFEFCIMLAIACTNYLAVASKFSWSCRHGRSFCDFDENAGNKLTMTNVLASKSLFRLFKRHMKREFSLEHLNFIVAIVHYKRLCEMRNFKFQNQNRNLTLSDCLKSKEISMQPVCSNNMKSEKTSNELNISSTVTHTDRMVLDGVGSELSMLPKHPPRVERKSRGSGRLSDVGAMLYWIKSNIAP